MRVRHATLVLESLHFDAPEQFLADFAAFEASRSGFVRLLDEPEFKMEIGPDGSAGDAWISFRVHRHINTDLGRAGSRSGHATIESGFPLPGDLVAKKLREFDALLHAPQVT